MTAKQPSATPGCDQTTLIFIRKPWIVHSNVYVPRRLSVCEYEPPLTLREWNRLTPCGPLISVTLWVSELAQAHRTLVPWRTVVWVGEKLESWTLTVFVPAARAGTATAAVSITATSTAAERARRVMALPFTGRSDPVPRTYRRMRTFRASAKKSPPPASQRARMRSRRP